MVGTPEQDSQVEVIRSNDPQFLFRDDSSWSPHTLPLHLEKDVEFYQVSLKHGGEMQSAPLSAHPRVRNRRKRYA